MDSGWEEGALPDFSINPVTMKPGEEKYITVNMTSNNLPVSEVSMSIYPPENITLSQSSFGIPGYRTNEDFVWKNVSYNSTKKCWELQFGSSSGNYAFGGDSGELFDFKATASNSFSQSASIVVKDVKVKYVHRQQEVELDDFSGAINYDGTKEVSENATTFYFGSFMTPGQHTMLKGTSSVIPIHLDWGFSDAPRQVSGTFIMPEGLAIDSLVQNKDVQPDNFNASNFRCMKTGTNKWQFITISYYPNYWKTHGTAPCFYLYVTATDDFTGGVITMNNIETVTQKTTDSGKYYCADATCEVSAVVLNEMQLSVQDIEQEASSGGSVSVPVKASWDGRDRVYSMRIFIDVPDGLTPTQATIDPTQGVLGHTASITKERDNYYRIGISNSDSDEYLLLNYGDLVTVDFAVSSGFTEGTVTCDSLWAKTMYYPSGCEAIKFHDIHFFSNGQPAVYGDVNGDGQVTAADVSAVYSIILGASTQYADSADVNGDGQVTAADVSAVYNIILGAS